MIDAKDEPLFQLTPEDEPHWQHTTVNALFDETVFPEQLVDHIKQHTEFQSLQFTVERIANENWVLKTQKQFHSHYHNIKWKQRMRYYSPQSCIDIGMEKIIREEGGSKQILGIKRK